VVSGGATMDEVVSAMPFAVGARVYNRTGLEGCYALRLGFRVDQTRFPLPKDSPLQSSNDLPDLFTAVQEQLGLKLVPQKTKEPAFVVDHIERPSEN
jgi:bla regulator protein BlaR1